MREKTTTVLLVLMMMSTTAVVLGGASTGDASASVAGDFEYTVDYVGWWGDERVVQITGYTGPGGEVVIPDAIEGLPVTSIGDYAFMGSAITSVVIPDTVTYIGSRAFSNSALTTVVIPDSVTQVSGAAFDMCTSLTSATVGDGVTSLGDSAFALCFRLSSVTIGSNVTEIYDDTFEHCYSLSSVIFPASVRSIGHSSFGYDFSLASVVFEGNAPAMESDWDYQRTAITGAAPLTAYFYHGATGFSLPSWNGLPSVCLPVRPGAPEDLMVRSGDRNVTLFWSAPADDGGAPIDHYVVYMNGAEFTTVPGDETQANITGLNDGEDYTFTVAAHSSVGLGPNSSEAMATPQAGRAALSPPTDDTSTCGPTDGSDGCPAVDPAGADTLTCPGTDSSGATGTPGGCDDVPSSPTSDACGGGPTSGGSTVDAANGMASEQQADPDQAVLLGGLGAVAAVAVVGVVAFRRRGKKG